MKVLGFLTAMFGFVFLSNLAYADNITLEMLNKRDDGQKMVYPEDVARVNVGDTVTWVSSKGHNVEIPAGPEGFDIQKNPKNNKEVIARHLMYLAFIITGVRPQEHGHDWLVIVGDDVSNKDAIAKAKAMGKSKKKLKALLGEL